MASKFLETCVVVGAGKIGFLAAGVAGTMRAPGLAICSAALLKGFDSNGKVVGFLMAHRQVYDNELKKALEEFKRNSNAHKWEVVAVQTAENHELAVPGSVFGEKRSSLTGLGTDLEVLGINANDVERLAEPGSEDLDCIGTRQLIVQIDAASKVTVEQSKPKSTWCTIM